MPRTNVDEVFNDFRNAQFKIDYSRYNPNSDDFMTALRLGLMWLVMKECGGKNQTTAEPDKKMPVQNEKTTAENDNIAEELQDAKKYHQMYLDSGDETYKSMAKDELGHAMTLIRKANLKMPTAEEKMKLRQYEDEYKKMTEQM